MKTESHYFISSSQKGLISNENPFGGPYTGTDDSLLFAIRDLDFKVSGIVEFYMSANCSLMDDKCKLALGFSHFKTPKIFSNSSVAWRVQANVQLGECICTL